MVCMVAPVITLCVCILIWLVQMHFLFDLHTHFVCVYSCYGTMVYSSFVIDGRKHNYGFELDASKGRT